MSEYNCYLCIRLYAFCCRLVWPASRCSEPYQREKLRDEARMGAAPQAGSCRAGPPNCFAPSDSLSRALQIGSTHRHQQQYRKKEKERPAMDFSNNALRASGWQRQQPAASLNRLRPHIGRNCR